MKKFLSLILAITIIVATVICAVPMAISAEEAPIEATPLEIVSTNRGWQSVKAITTTIPLGFTTAQGMVVRQNDAYMGTYAHESADDAIGSGTRFASMVYSESILFGTSTGIIIYVKTDAANQIVPYIALASGKSFTPKAGTDYQYAALGDTEWTTAQFGTGLAKNPYFGKVSFDAAFEGYIKIPYTSMGYDNGPSYVFNPETDAVSQIIYYFKGLGSNGLSTSDSTNVYGSVVVGPVFVVNKDSNSTKIAVPEEWMPAPIEATPLEIVGEPGRNYNFVKKVETTMPLGFTTAQGMIAMQNDVYAGSNAHESADGAVGNNGRFVAMNYSEQILFGASSGLIIYVKLDAANQIVPSVVLNGYKSLMGKVGYDYQYAAIDDTEWSTAKFVTGLTNSNYFGAVNFDSAFEGYIKIPYSSMGNDNSPSYVFNPETDSVMQIVFRFKGLGSNYLSTSDSTTVYGSAIVGPVLVVNSDSPSTKINVPEEFKPQPLEIKSFDFDEVRASGYNFSAEKIEDTNDYNLFINESVLSETPVKHQSGVEKWSYVENEDGSIASGGAACLVMTPTVDTYMKDAVGMVFYVKFSKANKFSPNLIFNDNKAYMLKPGTSVYLLENGSDEWVEKTVDIGSGTNTVIYGMVSFDEAFEGYIKVPFTSCNNDGGFRPVFTGDNMSALTSIAIRFKGIGDDAKYGAETVVGVTGYYTEDTSRAIIGSISEPDYDNNDINFDWKVNSDDLVATRKALLGYKGYSSRDLTILDLIRVKKILANAQ